MASPAADRGQPHQRHPLSESASEPAFLEAQKWIEVSHCPYQTHTGTLLDCRMTKYAYNLQTCNLPKSLKPRHVIILSCHKGTVNHAKRFYCLVTC